MFLKQKKYHIILRYHTSIYVTTLIGLDVPLKTLISVVCDTQMKLYFQKKNISITTELGFEAKSQKTSTSQIVCPKNHVSL